MLPPSSAPSGSECPPAEASPRPAPTLPSELIYRILQLANPPSLPYSARLEILASASLVSRSWRDVAQRELFRSVAVEVGPQLQALVSALGKGIGGRQLASWIIELCVNGRPAERVSARALWQLTSRCLSTTTLRLSWIDEMRLSDQAVLKSACVLSFPTLPTLTVPFIRTGRLETLIVEHTTFRVSFRGDEDIYPTIRHVGFYACSIIGLSVPSIDHPLGRFPGVCAFNLTKLEPLVPEDRAPAYRGRASTSSYYNRNVSFSLERFNTLLPSFESLEIISADSLHGLKSSPLTLEVPGYIRALDVAPPAYSEGSLPPSDVRSCFLSTLPRIVRLPAVPELLEALRIFWQQDPTHSACLQAISILPLGPPYDFSLYSSPECKAMEAFCNDRGIRLVYEDRPLMTSPFSEDGFWRFVRRVEEGEFGEKETDEIAEGMSRLAME